MATNTYTDSKLKTNPNGGFSEGLPVGGIFNTSTPTLSDGQLSALQMDGNGNVKVAVEAGGTSGTQYTDGTVAPTHPVGTEITFNNGGTMTAVSAANPLPVTGGGGGGGGLSVVDEAAFTAGTSDFTPTGGAFNDSLTALISGKQATTRLTAYRALHTNLRDSSGNELLGSKVSASSIPTVLASDQAAIPTNTTLTDASSHAITNSTAGADGGSNTSNRVPVSARQEGFNGTTWDRLRAGITGVFSAVTGVLNTLPVGQYNSTPPTLTNGQYTIVQMDGKGNLLVSLGTALSNTTDSIDTNHYQSAPSQTAISVGTSSTSVLAANSNRKKVILCNDSANIIYISFNGAAALNTGLRLNANGGTYIGDGGCIETGAITAISGTASSNLLVIEE